MMLIGIVHGSGLFSKSVIGGILLLLCCLLQQLCEGRGVRLELCSKSAVIPSLVMGCLQHSSVRLYGYPMDIHKTTIGSALWLSPRESLGPVGFVASFFR